jgi:hypothetical protein
MDLLILLCHGDSPRLSPYASATSAMVNAAVVAVPTSFAVPVPIATTAAAEARERTSVSAGSPV